MYLSIQAMRAAAAIMVVLFHASLMSGVLPLNEQRGSFLPAGVDIFFVISGFVMVASTDGKDLSAPQFLAARLVRIVPLYWLSMVLFLLWLSLGFADRPLPPSFEIMAAFAFIPYTDSFTGAQQPFLNVGWSLNYEMVFYLVFAAAIRLNAWKRLMVIGGFFAAKVALRPIIGDLGAAAFHHTSPLALEFVGGMLIGTLRHHAHRLPAIVGLTAVGVGFALLAMVLPGPRTLAFGGPAMLIIAGCIVAEPMFKRRELRPLALVGDASYSLYLGHAVILGPLALTGLFALPGQFAMWLSSAICVVAAIPIYRYIERPLTDWVRQRVAPPFTARLRPA